MESRITSIRYSSTVERRKPKEGDEKTLKSGVVYVRQARRTSWPMAGTLVGSRGQTLWEWVVKGGDRDRMKDKPRYGTDRKGNVLVPPTGYRILECGKPVPKGSLIYVHEYGRDEANAGWLSSTLSSKNESHCEGSVRAYAVKQEAK